MTRTAANFWLDLVSFVVMLGLALTGGITRYVLPAGTGNRLTLFGWGRHDVGQIHFYLGLAVVVLLALHLALHWSWLCGFVAKRLGKEPPGRRVRRLAGIAAVASVGLLLLAGWVGASALVEDRYAPMEWRRRATAEAAFHQGGEDCPAAAAINGRMTIAEAAAAAGLGTGAFLRALGVSYSVDPQERLGRLRRRFGFAMQDVRRLACSKR